MKPSDSCKLFAILPILLNSAIIFPQSNDSQTQGNLPASFYSGRRDALRNLMPPNSVFVLFAASEKRFAADVDYVYHQNPDMLYFSGYSEPNSMMYIFKEEQKIEGYDKPVKEVIFTPPVSMEEILYSGKRAGAEEVMRERGIELAVEASDYGAFPVDLSQFKMIITDRPPEDAREGNFPYSLSGLTKSFMTKAGIYKVPNSFYITLLSFLADLKNDAELKETTGMIRSNIGRYEGYLAGNPVLMRLINSTDSVTRAGIMDSLVNERINYLYFDRFTSSLRQIKTSEETDIIKKAVEITCNGHREVMKAATPDMSEREIQGIHEFIYKLLGAKETGFPMIIASGNNGCTLHYEDNDAPRVGNTLILMDVGAMFGGYSADVTRTIPANGKFSPEQLAIYNLVLEAQDSAFSNCKRGTPAGKIDKIARSIITDGLKKLGIIEQDDQSYIYYPHSISHPIGLDVHDKNINGTPLQNGMIITLEPGIYIPDGSKCDKKWWGIAVRIEDDILINDNDPEILSALAPRKPDEIEKLMRKSSPFNKFN